MLNIRDLKIDPASLGAKKLLVDIVPTEYSAKVEHPDRFELNSATAKIEQSNRRN